MRVTEKESKERERGEGGKKESTIEQARQGDREGQRDKREREKK